MDSVTDFLNATVTKEIYIKPTEGLPIEKPANCFRLKKALYGLKNLQENGTTILMDFYTTQ